MKIKIKINKIEVFNNAMKGQLYKAICTKQFVANSMVS